MVKREFNSSAYQSPHFASFGSAVTTQLGSASFESGVEKLHAAAKPAEDTITEDAAATAAKTVETTAPPAEDTITHTSSLVVTTIDTVDLSKNVTIEDLLLTLKKIDLELMHESLHQKHAWLEISVPIILTNIANDMEKDLLQQPL